MLRYIIKDTHMKFNLRMIFKMLWIVILLFFAIVFPYKFYIYLLRAIAAILFIINMMSLFKVFNIKIFFISKISNFIYNFMLKYRIYISNEKYNKLIFFLNIIPCLIIFLISFINESIFQNIVIGIFSGSLVSIFMCYYSYSYEKYKFYNNMIYNFEKMKLMMDSTIKEINRCGNVNISDGLEEIDLKVSSVVQFYNELSKIASDIISLINIYDDLSIMSIDAIENMHSKDIKIKKVKDICVEILYYGINKNKICIIENIRKLMSDILQFDKEILVFSSYVKDMRIYALKMKYGDENTNSMDFQEMMKEFNIKLEEYKDICEKLKDSRARCDDLRNKFMEQFK